MIIKCLFFEVGLILSMFCMAQHPIRTLKDVDGKLLLTYSEDSRDSIIYITHDGERLMVTMDGVEPAMGRDSLNSYVKRRYYAQENYDYVELNQRIYFTILFDEDLNIVEVRQLPPKIVHKGLLYKEFFIDTLKRTTGMWHKTTGNRAWYIYIYATHLY